MQKVWVVGLFMFSVSVFQPAFAQAGMLRRTFDSVSAAGFSGVILYAEQGKPVLYKASGFRSFETKNRLRTSDIFELASVSKQFTAMIIMMLQEKGLIGFDDSVSAYLQIPYRGITIRHLLTHTSGLPDYQAIMDAHWDKSKVAGNDDILTYLNRYAPPRLFYPGTQYAYSNTGYVLLASIAEKASGIDFLDLCRQWIFAPLGMRDTDIRSLSQKAGERRFAQGHLKDSTGQYVHAGRFRSADYTIWLGNRKGPGRISSTARDLLRWDAALYTNRLVSAATLKEAFSPMQLQDGTLSYYGFGWDLRTDGKGKLVVSHNGDNPGYKTIIIRFVQENKTLIILNNNAHSGIKALIAAVGEPDKD